MHCLLRCTACTFQVLYSISIYSSECWNQLILRKYPARQMDMMALKCASV